MFVGLGLRVMPATAAVDPSAAANQFFDMLNGTRAANGVGPLQRDPSLDTLALDWANHMADTFDRTGQVIDPAAPTDCERSGLCHRPNLATAIPLIEPSWRSAGENVGTGGDVVGLHNAFVASPGHFHNMIGDYNRLGVGVVVRGSRIWVTFNFLLGPPLRGVPASSDGALRISGDAPPTVTPPSSGGRYVAVTPRRVLDTRSSGVPVPAGTAVALDLTNEPSRPAGATAAVLNVTATEPRQGGFLTVYPCGVALPLASNVNFTAGATVPNSVAVALGADDRVCVYTNATVHVVVDVSGWFAASAADGMVPSAPVRVVDTRDAGNRVNDLVVPLDAMLPAGADAALLNVTVTDSLGAGYATVYPCGTAVPVASNINFQRGETRPNLVSTQLAPDRSVCIHTSSPAHVVVDLTGAYAPGGGALEAVSPSRFLDSRNGVGNWQGRLGIGQTIDVVVAGVAGVPSTASAVILNITVTDPAAAGYVTVYPCGQPVPVASNLNFVAGQTVANLAAVKIGDNQSICVFSSTRAHVVADLAGFVVPSA
jgi:hypothetical protein